MDEFSRSSSSEDYPSSFEDQTDGVIFEIDKAWFRRVIENLLANAVKHNEKAHILQLFYLKQMKKFESK